MRWMLVSALALTACAGADAPTGASRPAVSSTTADPAPSDPQATPTTPTTPATPAIGDLAPTTIVPLDASTPSTPPESPTTLDPDPVPVLPEGFGLVAARVTEPDGEVCDLCLWLADTADQRRRGLMFVTDLGPGDGMAFRYPEPHTGSFWMKNTVLPLSIAFFGADGGFLDAFDMAPCTEDPCPSYATPSGFLVAVEVPLGGLDGSGMGPGSSIELVDSPCP